MIPPRPPQEPARVRRMTPKEFWSCLAIFLVCVIYYSYDGERSMRWNAEALLLNFVFQSVFWVCLYCAQRGKFRDAWKKLSRQK